MPQMTKSAAQNRVVSSMITSPTGNVTTMTAAGGIQQQTVAAAGSNLPKTFVLGTPGQTLRLQNSSTAGTLVQNQIITTAGGQQKILMATGGRNSVQTLVSVY